MQKVRDTALKILARRGHSIAEVKQKLFKKDFHVADIMATLEWLQEERFLDDVSFAASRIKYRAEVSRWGRLRIMQELRQKGVDEDIATTEMAKFEAGLEQPLDPEAAPTKVRPDHDWQAEANALLAKKFGVLNKLQLPSGLEAEAKQAHYKKHEREKARRINFLLRRGFSSQQALQAVTKQLDADD